MEPGSSMPHSQGLSNNPYPHIDTFFFKTNSNIVLPSTLGLSKDLFPVGLPALDTSFK